MNDVGTDIKINYANPGPITYPDSKYNLGNWAVDSSSPLISSIINSLFNNVVPQKRESVFLSRTHQRVMDRALRRSVKIIA